MPRVPFKLKDDIYYVFQNLWPRYASVFCNVTDENRWSICLLCIFHQHCGTFAHLSYRTRRTFKNLGVYCLDRVDYNKLGVSFFCLIENVFQQCFAQDKAIGIVAAEPLRTEFNLPCALLSRNIKSFKIGAVKRYLQRQSRLSNSGFSANENNRTLYQSAAKNPVKLPISKGNTLLFGKFYCR